jgi:phosphoribosylformimino-5-aminoimidazole carboxamide ribotide isomerase
LDIIPVIDIKDGIVVHARRGDRAGYAPIKSRFTTSSTPQVVFDAVLNALDFAKFYIADLDAIAGHPRNEYAIKTIAAAHPTVEIWLDAGFNHPRAVERYVATPNINLVLATESIGSLMDYETLRNGVPSERLLLSLDRSGNDLLGCTDLFVQRHVWPDRIIHMNLGVVGTGDGPDFVGLQALQKEAAGREIYAAGGVRGADDLHRLAMLGVGGVLVATALHDGRIDASRIS